MDELIAYIILENHPYEITLNVSGVNKTIEQIITDIYQKISEEIGSDISFKLVYAKYKYLKLRNIELYYSLKKDYFQEQIDEKLKNLRRAFDFEDIISIWDEIFDEITKDFDNILRKYNFEKGQI